MQPSRELGGLYAQENAKDQDEVVGQKVGQKGGQENQAPTSRR
jgi:hypothetical protein